MNVGEPDGTDVDGERDGEADGETILFPPGRAGIIYPGAYVTVQASRFTMDDAEPLCIGFRVTPPPYAEDGTYLRFSNAAFCGAYCYALLGGHSIYRIKYAGRDSSWELAWSVPEGRRQAQVDPIVRAEGFTVLENGWMHVLDLKATSYKLVLKIFRAAAADNGVFYAQQITVLAPPDGAVPFVEPQVLLGLDRVSDPEIFTQGEGIYVCRPSTVLAHRPPFVYWYDGNGAPRGFYTFIHDHVMADIPARQGVVPAARTVVVPAWAQPLNPLGIVLHVAAFNFLTIRDKEGNAKIVYRLSSLTAYPPAGGLNKGACFISQDAYVAHVDGGAAVFRALGAGERGTELGVNVNAGDVQFKNERFVVSMESASPRITASRAGFVYQISDGDVTGSGHFLCSFSSVYGAVALFEVEQPETTLRLLGLPLPGPALNRLGGFLLGDLG